MFCTTLLVDTEVFLGQVHWCGSGLLRVGWPAARVRPGLEFPGLEHLRAWCAVLDGPWESVLSLWGKVYRSTRLSF